MIRIARYARQKKASQFYTLRYVVQVNARHVLIELEGKERHRRH